MALKPTKTKENGKTVYRDGNGKKITSSQYTKQLKAYNDSIAVYTTKKEIKNGKTTTTYYKNGKKISKSDYQKATTNKDTYEMRTQNGNTTYYKNGKQISQTAYNNFTSSSPKPYTENGKYYDKAGNEISKESYDSQVKAIQDKQAIEKSSVSWDKKSSTWNNQYQNTLEDLAKRILDTNDLKLERAKAINDNEEYIGTRDAIAKSLLDGSYYDQNTDPYAKQYRDDYIRQARIAADDTLANLTKRTGGLASSYAGAVANSKYNDFMDNLASKLLDLRSQAEASARNNVSMYDAFNNTYRTGQMQNNDVIGQNNSYASQEWNAYMQKLKGALDSYNDLANRSYQQWLQTQQMYQNQKMHEDDMAYKYAALSAQGASPVGGVRYSTGGGGGGGSSYSSNSGASTMDVAKSVASTALNALKDGFINNLTGSNSHSYTSNGSGTNLNQGTSYSLNSLGGVASPGIDYNKDPRFHK